MILLVLILALSVRPAPSAQESPGDSPPQDVGSICVAPLPRHAEELDHDYPGGKAPREFTYRFSVQIDQAEPVDVADDDPLRVAGLELSRTHQVIIRDDGTKIASLRFTFEERGHDLCLSYTPWYQTWQLDPPRPGAWWCRCDDV